MSAPPLSAAQEKLASGETTKRVYEVRQYTLSSTDAAQTYLGVWKKHKATLKKYGVTVLKYQIKPGSGGLTVREVQTVQIGASSELLGLAFVTGTGFQNDVKGWSMSTLVKSKSYYTTTKPSWA